MEDVKHKYEKALEDLAGMVEREGKDGGRVPSFEDICLGAGVDSCGFDSYIYGIFGLYGEEIMEVCRSRAPLMML